MTTPDFAFRLEEIYALILSEHLTRPSILLDGALKKIEDVLEDLDGHIMKKEVPWES